MRSGGRGGLPALALAVAFAVALAAGGCGGYVIRGKVVQGGFSTAEFIPAGDERLADEGLANVEVRLYRDATRPNERQVARTLSTQRGEIVLPVSEFGAGWMVEQWRIEAVAGGYQSADVVLTLPGSPGGQRLLILMSPGYTPPSSDDYMKQHEEFSR